MKILILAGGGGKRLWPVSRENNPKQIQPILGKKSLLEETYNRFSKKIGKENIYISTNAKQVSFIKEILGNFSQENLIIEPSKKDTAAAIGLGALYIYKKDPEAVIITANSDAFIENNEKYLKILEQGEKLVKDNSKKTVLVGIRPRYPETGYGYIKLKDEESKGKDFLEVEKFVEKPDFETAKKYVDSGEYLWNPAIFIWKADYLLSLYKKYLPEMHNILMTIGDSIGKEDEREVLEREFSKIEPISIDYGIMEKEENMLVVPGDFGWSDIGHWRAVLDVLTEKDVDNVERGKVISYDSRGNLIFNFTDKLISTCGLKDTVIVQTEDALLVCPKDKAQLVKNLLKEIENNNLKEYI